MPALWQQDRLRLLELGGQRLRVTVGAEPRQILRSAAEQEERRCTDRAPAGLGFLAPVQDGVQLLVTRIGANGDPPVALKGLTPGEGKTAPDQAW